MKKIGTTTEGNVIVELTVREFDGLQKLSANSARTGLNGNGSSIPAPQMSHPERAAFVAERLRKLSPKKKDGVIRSVEAMFQFTGGIEPAEIERVLSTLQKKKVISIAPDGKVSYPNT